MNLIKKNIPIYVRKNVAYTLLTLQEFYLERNAIDVFVKLIAKVQKSFIEIAGTAHIQKQQNLENISKKYKNQEYCTDYPFYIFYEITSESCLIEAMLYSNQDYDRILAKKRDRVVTVKLDENIRETAKKTIVKIENELENSKNNDVKKISFKKFFQMIMK